MNDLFEELKRFNNTVYTDIEFTSKKIELKNKLDSLYKKKRDDLEKKLRDDRRKFCKQPTKSLIECIQKRNKENEIEIYRMENNEITSNKSEILGDLFKFYQSLLGEERVKPEKIKNYSFKMRKLDQKVKGMHPDIGKNITYNEVFEVIKDMEDSAPGCNGLTINFFKKFFFSFWRLLCRNFE